MPVLAQHSAAQFTLEQLVDLFAASFEGYLVPIAQPLPALSARIRGEQVDLALSRVIAAGDEPAGLCLLAVRGQRVRVAAMGVARRWRRAGLGRALLGGAIEAARGAGGRRLLLEVFEENQAAVALYRAAGFAPVRRLVGHERPAFEARAAAEHRRADTEELAAALAAEPDRRWPWQLSPHTLVSAGAPSEVHALADAYAVVNRADPLRLALRLLYVAPAARRRGLAGRLLASIQALHPQAAWSIPPAVPEEFSPEALAALGFRRAGLSQLEMERPLEP
jgi:ribosomal protein S18 acetylase RimI-like enzyme